MQSIFRKLLILCCGFCASRAAFAYNQAPQRPQGFGAVANNMLVPVTVTASFVASIAISLGICFLLAAVIKYMRHRENPLAYPISTVVLLVIMALILLALPFAYRITQAGFPAF